MVNSTYYKENKERVDGYNRKWREANPEKYRQIQRNWRAKNEGRTYEASNGYVYYIGYKHPATAPSGHTGYHRIVLWEKLNGQDAPCNWCGKTVYWSVAHPSPDALVTDHVNTVKNDNRPENLVPSCSSCNTSRPGGRLPSSVVPTQVGDCTFEGCDRPQVSKHLCGTHFNQQWAGRELTPIRKHTKTQFIDATHKQCTVCDEIKLHAEFYIRNGKPKGPCKRCEIDRIRDAKERRLARGIPCAIDDCERPADTKGLCTSHYGQAWYAGREAV